MQVVVDTSVWSLVLRRRALPGDASDAVLAFKDLISDARAMLIGPVRQELLSGIREPAQFEPLTAQDDECAAGFFNTFKAEGIQSSHTDFLICAVAKQRNLPVFSLDQDFMHFSQCLPLSLFGLQT